MYTDIQKALLLGVAYTSAIASECSYHTSKGRCVVDDLFKKWARVEASFKLVWVIPWCTTVAGVACAKKMHPDQHKMFAFEVRLRSPLKQITEKPFAIKFSSYRLKKRKEKLFCFPKLLKCLTPTVPSFFSLSKCLMKATEAGYFDDEASFSFLLL